MDRYWGTIHVQKDRNLDLRESQAVDAISEHISKQRGVGVESWEVGVHVRRLPVGHPWHDHLK